MRQRVEREEILERSLRVFEMAERYASGDLCPDDWAPLCETLRSLPGVVDVSVSQSEPVAEQGLVVLPLVSSGGASLHVGLWISDRAAFKPCHRAVEL